MEGSALQSTMDLLFSPLDYLYYNTDFLLCQVLFLFFSPRASAPLYLLPQVAPCFTSRFRCYVVLLGLVSPVPSGCPRSHPRSVFIISQDFCFVKRFFEVFWESWESNPRLSTFLTRTVAPPVGDFLIFLACSCFPHLCLYYITGFLKSQGVFSIFLKRFYFTYTKLCAWERLFSFSPWLPLL